MPDTVVQDAATGQAAISLLKPQFDAIPEDELSIPRLDAQEAAAAGIGLDQALKERPALVARFKALGSLDGEFDPMLLDQLQPACRAVFHTRTTLKAVQAAATTAKVPVGLAEEAEALKDRMMRVLVYNLETSKEASHKAAMDELRAIRSGRGYVDLAEDLARLAELYRAHAPTLAKDTINYSATDPSEAEAKAHAIQDSLGAAKSFKDSPERELAVRAWTFFYRTYMEIVVTGRWLLRKEPALAAKLFPPLSFGRRAGRRTASTEPAPSSQDHG